MKSTIQNLMLAEKKASQLFREIELRGLLIPGKTELEINKSVLVQKKFYFVNELLDNIKDINFTDNSIIRPIYVSNNAVLN